MFTSCEKEKLNIEEVLDVEETLNLKYYYEDGYIMAQQAPGPQTGNTQFAAMCAFKVIEYALLGKGINLPATAILLQYAQKKI